jgi:hypothetical protein
MQHEQTLSTPADAHAARLARIDATLSAARAILAPFRRASALAGIRAIEVALGSLRRRIEADEDVTTQIRTIAQLVLNLEQTLGGGR